MKDPVRGAAHLISKGDEWCRRAFRIGSVVFGIMKRFVLAALVLGLTAAGLRAGPFTIPVYINSGNVTWTNMPQIDAYGFINLGRFVVDSTPAIYDFMNVLDYTNRGTMIGYPGFRFDCTDDFGVRRPARQFVNTGSILAQEGFIMLGYSNMVAPTYLHIRATNVVSPGLLSVMNAGSLRIEGDYVNLTRGGLAVEPMASYMFANSYTYDENGVPISFTPDNAIYDNYWGIGQQDPNDPGPINTSRILQFTGQGVIAQTPVHYVLNKYGNRYLTAFSTFVPSSYNTTYAYTGVVDGLTVVLTNFDGSISNVFVPTNIYRQAVVVGLNDTNIQVRTKFSPIYSRTDFSAVAVELSAPTTNNVTGDKEINSIYFVDYLAAETNLVNVANEVSVPIATGRPYMYEIWREMPGVFSLGVNGNTELFRSIVYDSAFSNRLATNFYAGYSASIDYIQSRAPAVPGASPTNLPGRIDIAADKLDLSMTRLRGMSAINIKANHLISSSAATLDAPNLAYDLSSTNGLLTITNLAKISADRFYGSLRAWSGLWTNQFAIILSNWVWSADGTSNYFSPITNSVDCGIHCLILSADGMISTQAVVVHSFTARSTNVVVNDGLIVGGAFNLDAQSFTVNGMLILTNQLVDWVYTNAPTLKYFTNNGSVSVPNIANYGYGYPGNKRWTRVSNAGTLEAVGHNIACDEFIDTGNIVTRADFLLMGGDAKLEGARQLTAGDAHYRLVNMKLRSATISAGRSVFLDVENDLSDSGVGANNQISVNEGFHLVRKPNTGALFGTTFTTTAPRYYSISHTWAAEDRGAKKEGFENNAAIGRLQLRLYPYGELRFGPPTDNQGNPVQGNFAIYVDYLDLDPSLVADPEAGGLVIEPGLTVYFAYANAPAETLDGMFEGRLRWVKDFAGPNSGIDVAVHVGPNSYKTIRVNRALLESKLIDSDGDGLANAYDQWPFDGPTLGPVKVSGTPPTVSISFAAAAGATYYVERTSNLAAPEWVTIATVTNDAAVGKVMTVTDPVPALPEGRERYYRVRYNP